MSAPTRLPGGTAAIAEASATTSPASTRLSHRVACGCGWVGYRARPTARGCPRCGTGPAGLWPVWLAGCAPRRGRCAYLAHLWPVYRHAGHYLGFSANLPVRWAEHVGTGYDPVTRRALGNGARLLAAARHAGCRLELVRVWYGDQARALEQRLKQRHKPGSLRAGAARSLKPLCPVCSPGAYRRYPELPKPLVPPRPRPVVTDPAVWDADREWDLAFPHLAYGPVAASEEWADANPDPLEEWADANPDPLEDGRAPAPQPAAAASLTAQTALAARTAPGPYPELAGPEFAAPGRLLVAATACPATGGGRS